MKSRKFSFLFLLLLLVAPVVQGFTPGNVVNTKVWLEDTAFSSKTYGPVSLDGTSDHSLVWEYTDVVTITVEIGVLLPDGSFAYVTSSSVGPFSGAGPSVEPLFLPVAKYVRFTVTGTDVTGYLAFNAS